jgi:hypothetical protein
MTEDLFSNRLAESKQKIKEKCSEILIEVKSGGPFSSDIVITATFSAVGEKDKVRCYYSDLKSCLKGIETMLFV